MKIHDTTMREIDLVVKKAMHEGRSQLNIQEIVFVIQVTRRMLEVLEEQLLMEEDRK